MADSKSKGGKKYGADFSREMGMDPNMGMNPAWKRKNPDFKPGKFKVSHSKNK